MYWEKLVGKKVADVSKHIDELVDDNRQNKKLKRELTSLELEEVKQAIDTLIAIVEEQDEDIETLKEKLKYEKEDKQDNYRPINVASQVGWHHKW